MQRQFNTDRLEVNKIADTIQHRQIGSKQNCRDNTTQTDKKSTQLQRQWRTDRLVGNTIAVTIRTDRLEVNKIVETHHR